MVSEERVALFLAGGGARGAYEAGVLSILLPELDRHGRRPSLFIGTSVGAVNAAYLAAVRHRPVEEAATGLVERWREAGRGPILRPLREQLPRVAGRYLAQVLSVPGHPLSSLLDPAPFERRLRHWIDLEAVHHNVAHADVDALAVVATAVRSGRTVVFVEGSMPPSPHRSHVLDYLPATIDHTHLRASAALPVLFPSVRIDTPAEARGWYVDGGTRLHAPLKPALDLGADRIVVIGTEAVTPAPDEPGRHEGRPPDLADGALHLLAGALVDPLAEDIMRLGNINLYYATPPDAPSATRYRQDHGKPPYRSVPYIFVVPDRRGAIGEHALEILRSRSRNVGMDFVQHWLVNRLFGGDRLAQGELLSYLFFDPQYLDELIAMGQRDARSLLAHVAGDDPWQLGPLAWAPDRQL